MRKFGCSWSGKQHLFVAIGVTKFTYFAFFDFATKRNGAEFLRQVVQTFPYKSHTVLTDNGVAFTEQPRYRNGATNRFGGHIFDRVYHEHAIKHRLTKAYHPWTNGQVERMNRTIKDATIKAFHSGKDGQKIAGHATEGMTKNYQKGHEDVVWSEVEADLDIGEIAG
jgi:hypothetical protein